ncbi:RNA pyrophosphohydrolase [Campylobacter geochelonis]|uniref:Dinucleoside polyphosphate hydrolase n=1 Tax=Campylobacter geochelonis TaxID=1780362 RepID=A0A128EF36_9BACT|nr:RNA pyrophosphohydrolase [Campylobacter geochelonis]QKF71025.1 RNA pyrophosphohydrolase [Campylobacter geochelonis]CZE47177.1 dinucleoside polyphosphate hydrolase [Campylobacter geochelonis]CZE47653.1 dinucleoside polyphosphate hydrolase [Campylobacter geochelonis]CZE50159.1 dinucleoside polyphosphate hydrolase [Campylobacter geochelonis]
MEKNYRPNVAAIVLSPTYPFDCRIFLGQRSDIKGAWQFPQGGIDSGETPKMALFRELKEEIGTNEVEIITEYPQWLSYDFPETVLEKMKPYDGQIQRYFLVRLKSGASINLCTKLPEFDEYKFVQADEVVKNVRHFKKGVYSTVLKYFRKEGYI